VSNPYTYTTSVPWAHDDTITETKLDQMVNNGHFNYEEVGIRVAGGQAAQAGAYSVQGLLMTLCNAKFTVKLGGLSWDTASVSESGGWVDFGSGVRDLSISAATSEQLHTLELEGKVQPNGSGSWVSVGVVASVRLYKWKAMGNGYLSVFGQVFCDVVGYDDTNSHAYAYLRGVTAFLHRDTQSW